MHAWPRVPENSQEKPFIEDIEAEPIRSYKAILNRNPRQARSRTASTIIMASRFLAYGPAGAQSYQEEEAD